MFFNSVRNFRKIFFRSPRVRLKFFKERRQILVNCKRLQQIKSLKVPFVLKKTSVADPHWFKCGSGFGSSVYLNADPDPGSQTNADPYGSRSWSDFASQKVGFCQEKYTGTLCRQYVIKKYLFKRLESCLFC
jgi:hypothetical protein